MVWNSNQSSLYRAVEAHNSGFSARSEKCGCEEEFNAPPHRECGCERDIPPLERSSAAQRHSIERSSPAPKSGGNLIERLLSDSDNLLLGALLMVLIHEKADKNLIIAIALIMIL